MTPIKLHYSEALVRRAVRSFWHRSLGWKYIAALLILFAGLASMLWGGDRSWQVGVGGAVLGFGVLFGVVLYLAHYRASLTRFRRMQIPEASLELGDERFRISSDVGSSDLAWSVITEVWRFPEFWLIFVSRGQFITIPTADLDPETREFLIAKINSNGIKVL
jgi:drug/metabolite transporter (DMT)-like permease